MQKKAIIAATMAILALVLIAGTALAQDGLVISFGIRPTRAYEDRPETFSYFSYEMTPGQVLNDEALVLNDGDVPLTLLLYAADAITAQNGGTAFMHRDQESPGGQRGVGRWIVPSMWEISLQPGEEQVVAFSVTVPEDATPGQHVAGLLVEAPPTGQGTEDGESSTQFAVRIIRRVGVAVVIDVPGPRVAELDVIGATLSQQSDQGATFQIEVSNNGNIFLKAEGTLTVMAPDGSKLATIPLSLDTVLPGDTAVFHVTYPIHLYSGDYLLSVFLDYGAGTAVLDSVPLGVEYGEVPAWPGEQSPESPAGEVAPEGTPQSALSPLQIVVLLSALLVGAAVVCFLILRLRRSRLRKQKLPSQVRPIGDM